VHKIVYDVVYRVLKPFLPSGKAEDYAKMVADKVTEKVTEYMKEGSARKISEAVATGACNALSLVPLGGKVLQRLCNMGKPLLVKGLLFAINPICKLTKCCTPESRVPSQSEYQQAMEFNLDGESDSSDESGYQYLSASEARKPCKNQLELAMSRGIAHIVHYLLQQEQHMTEAIRQRKAREVETEVKNAIKKALKDGANISESVVDAVDRALDQGAAKFNDFIKHASKSILDLLSSHQKCSFPGQN